MIRGHCRFTVLPTRSSLYLCVGLLLHFLPVNARAAERTYDQWYSEMPAVQRAYARSLAASIKKNVPDAKQIDPRKFTYGDKQVVDALANRAVAAARKRDEETAVA